MAMNDIGLPISMFEWEKSESPWRGGVEIAISYGNEDERRKQQGTRPWQI
jgi:hypothetical protein